MGSKQLRLFTGMGVPVYVHWTTMIFLGAVTLPFLLFGELSMAMNTLVTFSALYGSVVAHEFGHIYAAKRHSIPVRDVVIYPIGGVAALQGGPQSPLASFGVSIAGPLVSVLIALIPIYVYVGLMAWSPGSAIWLEQTVIFNETGIGWLAWFSMVNFIITAFNLLPIFPLDGGQMLHAVMWWCFDKRRAYQFAVKGAVFGGIGLFALAVVKLDPFLMMIGGMISFFGSGYAKNALKHDPQAR